MPGWQPQAQLGDGSAQNVIPAEAGIQFLSSWQISAAGPPGPTLSGLLQLKR